MSEQPLTLLIVDDDPIFRLGLATALNSFESIRVLDEASTPAEALEKLAAQSFSIIILEPELTPNSSKGWQLYQRIKQQYPTQKICLVSRSQNINQLLTAQNRGIEGYCPKGFAIAQLVGILQQIAQGKIYWEGINHLSQPSVKRSRQPWFAQTRRSGIEQINHQLTLVNQHLKSSKIPLIDRLFWQGRKRELLTARWLIQQLLPIEVVVIPEDSTDSPSLATEAAFVAPSSSLIISPSSALVLPSLFQRPYVETVFNNTFNQLQGTLKNATKTPLEIDILQPEKMQGLLLIIFNQLSQLFEQLRFSEITASQLPQNLASFLEPIWQKSSLTFLSKYCLAASPYTIDDIQELLEEDQYLIQEEVLNKIPFLVELANYLLFEKPLIIQGVEYRPESPEAIERAEKLLQNVLIKIANAVMIFILNNFSEQEIIKDSLYREKLLSSREIAKFRNDLSWQYRLDKYWETPKQIFESQYQVYYLGTKGLEDTYLYFPRQDELNQLQGLPRLVTIIIEIRDALAPRLRSVTGWLGEGVIYVLTQVIGRAIGLVGRGIIQGVGTTWQEARYGKNNRQEKQKSES